MTSEKPLLFPDSKIEGPKPVNTHDNDTLLSARKNNVFAKDTAKQMEKDEEGLSDRRTKAKEETGTISAEERERSERIKKYA